MMALKSTALLNDGRPWLQYLVRYTLNFTLNFTLASFVKTQLALILKHPRQLPLHHLLYLLMLPSQPSLLGLPVPY
jgi:hypothetical protein